jgi:hypothetical protein
MRLVARDHAGRENDAVDITQHLRVIRRWRKVIICSGALGVVLALVFVVKISWHGGPTIDYRRAQKWQSTSTLFVTQRGFPWGRTTLPSQDTTAAGQPIPPSAVQQAAKDANGTSFADPSRLSLLAVIYSFIAQSNAIKQINTKLPPGGEVTAQELSTSSNDTLPLFTLTATARTKEAATALNDERTQALQRYLSDQQASNDVPAGQRVEVNLLNRPKAELVASHGAALALALIFLSLAAGVASSYLLESLRLSREGGDEDAPDIAPAQGQGQARHPQRRSKARQRRTAG